MTQLALFIDTWGWRATLFTAALYFLGKSTYFVAQHYRTLLDWMARWLPFLERHQMSHQEAQRFAREQKSKARSLTAEQLERQETIGVLQATLTLLRQDKKEEQLERRALQQSLLTIEAERSRRETETIEVLRGLASLVSLQTDRLSDLTVVIERIVGATG